jgi:hypothetical protein
VKNVVNEEGYKLVRSDSSDLFNTRGIRQQLPYAPETGRSIIIRPSVHGMSPVTHSVHFLKISLTVHSSEIREIFAGQVFFFVFFSLFWPEISIVTVTCAQSV